MSKGERLDKIVHDLATAVVLNTENNYTSTHLALSKALKDHDPKDAAEERAMFLAEKFRTDPKGKWDEEEQMVGNLENRKKKK